MNAVPVSAAAGTSTVLTKIAAPAKMPAGGGTAVYCESSSAQQCCAGQEAVSAADLPLLLLLQAYSPVAAREMP